MNMNQYYYRTVPCITSFRGPYAFLSNFYDAEIYYHNLRFSNNEAAFQAQKTTCPRERRRFCSPYLSNPSDAKRLGRTISLRYDWEAVKLQYMYEICMSKFMQHPVLAAKLIATGNAILMEENTWGDRYWGVVNGSGRNLLGQILMDIRTKLRLEQEVQNFHKMSYPQ